MEEEQHQINQSPTSLPPQQHDHHLLQSLPTQPQPSGPVDALTCQWLGCGERTSSPETLYDHVCERHIGRKSTNNLNLTCAWGACRTTTVKRDHITSHMRVHVPLKPHKCDFCGKAFKRPQDLKKHVKTHADDSVLLRSPEASMGQQQNVNNPFHQQDNKNGAYFASHDMSGGYPPNGNVGSNNNFYPTPQYSGYGQVSYPGTSMADQQSMDTRRRAIEALNDFLGDVKRRAIDPSNYYDVGQRLGTQSLPLPVSIGAGYSLGNNYSSGTTQYSNGNGGMDSFGGSHGGLSLNDGGAALGGALTQNYSLPISHARSKTDLLDIDRFLEQLQSTVYESSGQAAAAGIQQPGIHAQAPARYPGFNNNIRHSQSPPGAQQQHSMSGAAQPLSSVAQMANMTATVQGLDTPALTPASVSSYASSGHSPMSSHSRPSVDGRSMYPQLPSVAPVSDIGQGYTSAPPSGLATGFEPFDTRRYSGGRLQREAPGPRRAVDSESDAMDVDGDRATTPRNGEDKEHRRAASSSNVDPALRGTPSPDRVDEEQPGSDGSDDRAQETWVENVRVIEYLRSWVRDRLAQGDFERDQDSTPEAQPIEEGIDERLKREFSAREEAERLEQEQQQQQQQQEEINYPTLKTEA